MNLYMHRPAIELIPLAPIFLVTIAVLVRHVAKNEIERALSRWFFTPLAALLVVFTFVESPKRS